MKRIFLFLLTNLAVMVTLMILWTAISLFIDTSSMDGELGIVFAWALLFGMGGSMISLLASKFFARMAVGAKNINGTEGDTEGWLVRTVEQLAESAGVKMPEVAVYDGAPNAFATGAFRNHALVAVSTGAIRGMTREELRAVLGHEMSHVANGDMVTMGLVQGVINVFAIVVSHLAARAFSSGRNGRRNYFAYRLIYNVVHLALSMLGMLVAMAFSRHREYRADAGSAKLLGSPRPMIAALRRLGALSSQPLPDSLAAFGVNGKHASWLSTHPSLEDRIAALERLSGGVV